MKIALVKPPQETNEIQPPLGLGYLASTVRGFSDVVIVDSIKENISVEFLLKKLIKGNFDIIGFQCYTVDFNTVKFLTKKIKETNPDTVVVLGGPHPTLDPINTLKHIKADYVFLGDSEISFPRFIKFFEEKKLTKQNLKKIPGFAYRDESSTKMNPSEYPCELDKFNPSWDLFGLKDYPLAPHGAFCKQSPTAPLIITRGCPFNCTYCGGPKISGRRIRSHSVEYMLKQIDILVKKYGIRELHIEDDNFTMNRKFVMDFCNKLIERNYGLTWTCPNGVRIDTLDRELIRLMKRSGLYALSVGIESGSERVRKLMRKSLPTRIIREKMGLLEKEGIDLIGFFIVGYPGETVEDINQTIALSMELGLIRATFSAFKPFPGTDIYNILVAKKEIEKMDYNRFSLDRIVWSPKGISIKQLKDLRRKAFMKFYFRPRIMFAMVKEIKSFNNLKFIVIRAYRWLIK